jgi:hypothetical protein
MIERFEKHRPEDVMSDQNEVYNKLHMEII